MGNSGTWPVAIVARGYVPVTCGTVTYRGQDVRAARGRDLRAIRRKLQMVFQDPYASLNPRRSIGKTLADVERDLILDTLKHYLGNRTHAANILGISIRTLP